MRRLLVNDALNQLGERTFWNDLQEWFGCEFVGGEYGLLQEWFNVSLCVAQAEALPNDSEYPTLIIRNASYFPPLKLKYPTPTISLLQDIFTEGPQRAMQEEVIKSSRFVVFNSQFTKDKYRPVERGSHLVGTYPYAIIPLPVDFSLFEPQNPMGCQQALGLPDGCVLWVGASQGAAGHVKGFDIFRSVVRTNPDIHFVAVLKDAAPDMVPPNLRCYVRLPHEELVRVIGACRVGLCTSRMESQHLAGIEMGACGLPLVAPPVGIYWKGNISGVEVNEPTVQSYTQAIRAMLSMKPDPQHARGFWQKQCDRPVIRAAWEGLVEEVECRNIA